MAVTLPSSPNNGDAWTVGGIQYTWDGSTWVRPTIDGDIANVAGDTMTGDLILNGDPTTNLAAATKQYVDNRESIASGSEVTNITSTGVAPTKGTTQFDFISYELIGHKLYFIKMVYRQLTAGTIGTGTYLVKLPAGLQFSTPNPHPIFDGNITNIGFSDYTDMCHDPLSGGRISSDTASVTSTVKMVPYSATHFRIVNEVPLQYTPVGIGNIWGASFFNFGPSSASQIVTCSFVMKAV